MKKLIFTTAISVVSISATEANWGGFYVRGGISLHGGGGTAKFNDQIINIPETADGQSRKSGFKLASSLEIATGYGMTVSNSVYFGVDAQLINFEMAYYSTDAAEIPTKTESKSETNFAWIPNLQLRIGLPLQSSIPYIAGGFGLVKLFKEENFPKIGGGTINRTPDMMFSWSVRVGSDFKVSESFFLGIYAQLTKVFEQEIVKDTNVKVGGYSLESGFTIGYQF